MPIHHATLWDATMPAMCTPEWIQAALTPVEGVATYWCSQSDVHLREVTLNEGHALHCSTDMHVKAMQPVQPVRIM